MSQKRKHSEIKNDDPKNDDPKNDDPKNDNKRNRYNNNRPPIKPPPILRLMLGCFNDDNLCQFRITAPIQSCTFRKEIG